jgi:diguanylate cyclase (GGDEF)-like protein
MQGVFRETWSAVPLPVVAAVLVFAAFWHPPLLATMGPAVVTAGFLVALFVALWNARTDSGTKAGRVALSAGIACLALSETVVLSPSMARTLGLLVPAVASTPDTLGLVLRGTGSVGLGIGFALWVGTSASRAAAAESRALALTASVAKLEEKVRSQAEQLHEALSADDLTGVLNQRAFLKRLEETMQRDCRLDKPFAFLLIQTAGLRSLAAEDGRHAAERALAHVASALRGATRGTDAVGRVGNEEFAVALGECSDPFPAISRLFLGLTDGPKFGKDKKPVRVRVGAVTIPHVTLGVEINEIFRAAEEITRSLPANDESQWAKREIGAAAALGGEAMPAAVQI